MPLWRLINCQFTKQLGKRNNTPILCQCLQTSQVYSKSTFFFTSVRSKIHLKFSEKLKNGKKVVITFASTKAEYNIITSCRIALYMSLVHSG